MNQICERELSVEEKADLSLPLSEAIQFSLGFLLAGSEVPYQLAKKIRRFTKGTVSPKTNNYYVSLRTAAKRGLIIYPEQGVTGKGPGKGLEISITDIGKVALDLQLKRHERFLAFSQRARRADNPFIT